MFNRIIKSTVIISVVFIACNIAYAFVNSTLTGRVMDADGNAATGAEIFVYDSPDTRRPADFIFGRTGFDGRFRMMIPPGTYWVVARLRSSERYGPLMPGDKHSGEAVEIQIDPGEEYEQDFTVIDIREAARLIKKTREDHYKLSGIITDRKGVPVRDVYAAAYRGSTGKEMPDYMSSWTGEEGVYKLYLPAGRYYVRHAFEFPPEMKNVIYKEVIIKGDVTGFNIRIDSLDIRPPDEEDPGEIE